MSKLARAPLAMESCSVVLGPLKLLCAAAPGASAAAAPGGASVATHALLALLLLIPVLRVTLSRAPVLRAQLLLLLLADSEVRWGNRADYALYVAHTICGSYYYMWLILYAICGS